MNTKINFEFTPPLTAKTSQNKSIAYRFSDDPTEYGGEVYIIYDESGNISRVMLSLKTMFRGDSEIPLDYPITPLRKLTREQVLELRIDQSGRKNLSALFRNSQANLPPENEQWRSSSIE